MHDWRRTSQSRWSFSSAANENGGSVLAIDNGGSLDTPADESEALSQAALWIVTILWSSS